jgi:polysaccharide pyruvyl transferase WcaK-like protein
LQNCSAHGNRSLLYYLALLYLARFWRRPVCLVANGIGPLQGGMARRAVARALRHIDRISVRDEGSRRLAISLGLSEEKVQVEPDPVLFLSPGSIRDADRMIDAYLPSEAAGHRLIGICPRPSEAEAALTAAMARLWQEDGLYPVFFAFDRERDGALCERMMAASGIGCRLPAEDEALVAAVLGHRRVAAVIAQRLHASILSHLAGRKAVVVNYSAHDGKQAAFASTVGQPILPVSATCEAIVSAARGTLNRHDE